MSFLRNRIIKLSRKGRNLFKEKNKLSIEEEKKYIDSFKNPQNDFERSFFHYKCFFLNYKRFGLIIANVMSLFLIPAVYIRATINTFVVKSVDKVDAVLIADRSLTYTYEDKLPKELISEYKNFYTVKLERFPGFATVRFGNGVLKYCFRLSLRFFFHPLLQFSCLFHLLSANGIVFMYAPKALINYRVEAKYSTSVVTGFLESLGIEHVCFMNGSRVKSKIYAFFRLSRMYIFDEYYKDIYLWARSDSNFIAYRPALYDYDLESQIIDNKCYLTYYCSGNHEWEKLKNILTLFVRAGKKCRVRPHPRYSDVKTMKKVFQGTGIEIEICNEVSIEKSIANSEYVVGQFSTVIESAYYCKKKVVIDDITDTENYEYMVNAGYFMFHKKHLSLSELLSDFKYGNIEQNLD